MDLEATRSSNTISSLARQCTSGFVSCIESSYQGDLEAINDAHGRFNVWAANLGISIGISCASPDVY